MTQFQVVVKGRVCSVYQNCINAVAEVLELPPNSCLIWSSTPEIPPMKLTRAATYGISAVAHLANATPGEVVSNTTICNA